MKKIAIENYSRYIDFLKKKKIILLISSLIYFCTWSETLGSVYLQRKILKISNLKKTKLKIFIEICNLFHFYDFQVINEKIKSKKIIFTWCRITDFKKNKYFDRYTNQTSSNTQTHWIALSSDGKIPKNIPKNVTFVLRKKIFSLSKLLEFLSFIFNKKNIFFVCLKFYFNLETKFSFFLSQVILKKFQFNRLNKILFIYESQPFQNLLIKNIKDINKKIIIEGYIHSGLPAFPANYVKKDFSPDRIFVDSKIYKKILINFLNWKDKELIVQKSLRFKKTSIYKFQKKIFLPYNVDGYEIYLNSLEKLNLNFSEYDVLNHPLKKSSLKHQRFVKKLKNLLNETATNKRKISIPICFGHTQTIIEALSNDSEVMHLYNNEILHCFNSSIWREIKTTKLLPNVSIYKSNKRIFKF